MINLKEYITEKFKISKDIKDDTFYILYFKDLPKLKNLDNLEKIEPICKLKEEDIDLESSDLLIKVNNKWIEINNLENTNYGDEDEPPQEGDLVFYLKDEREYVLNRPSFKNASYAHKADAYIGVKEGIIYMLKMYCDSYDKKYDIEELK